MLEGYSLKEWFKWHFYKPTIFQRILWYFWPTMSMMKYNKYKNFNLIREFEKEEDRKRYYIRDER